MLLLVSTTASADGSVTTKKTLTLDGAKKAIAAAVAEARKSNATGVVAVVDDGGNLMALERLDGTFAAGANISIGKARTAVLFKKPTRFFEDVIGKGRTAMVAVDFTPLQGGDSDRGRRPGRRRHRRQRRLERAAGRRARHRGRRRRGRRRPTETRDAARRDAMKMHRSRSRRAWA